MSIEAMKQALEALSNTDTHPISSAEQYFKETQAMEALEDAIKDVEEQNPICKNDLQVEICKRRWAGLTDKEILQCYSAITKDAWDCIGFARAIEDNLKEKNS